MIKLFNVTGRNDEDAICILDYSNNEIWITDTSLVDGKMTAFWQHRVLDFCIVLFYCMNSAFRQAQIRRLHKPVATWPRKC